LTYFYEKIKMENEVTKERMVAAIKAAAIKQGKHPLQVIREMKLKIERDKQKRDNEIP
jgi:hypothetical protein